MHKAVIYDRIMENLSYYDLTIKCFRSDKTIMNISDMRSLQITKCSKRQQENTVHASQNLDLMGEWQVVTSTYQAYPCALRAQDMPACN